MERIDEKQQHPNKGECKACGEPCKAKKANRCCSQQCCYGKGCLREMDHSNDIIHSYNKKHGICLCNNTSSLN